MVSLAAKLPFDESLNFRATLDDLSRELMNDFLKEVGSDLAVRADELPLAQLGRQMNVIGGSPEASVPLNVGLLFFNAEPHRFFPGTQIDVLWLPAGAGSNKPTKKAFYGPLPRMLREALDYIRRNYIDETVIKHRDRAEAARVENFPFPAIEEALINTVYHRNYEERQPIKVSVSRNELIVVSYPGPDQSIRLEQLRVGKAISRHFRNRRIGEFLKKLKIANGRSRGISKIINAMRQNGSPSPAFEFDEDRGYFLVRLPVHLDVPQFRTA